MNGGLHLRPHLRIPATVAIAAAMLAADSWSSQPMLPDLTPGAEFHFVRLTYTANPAFFAGGGSQRWLTDWPDAETHLLQGVRRLTRIDTAEQGNSLSIMDDNLYDYPWIYAVEVGGWSLSDEEAARLRDYLLRGGLLVVDDFHGTREWAGFMESMSRVFPDRAVIDIPIDDAVFHLAYDLNEQIQIPGIQSLYTGRTYERDGYEPHWRGIYDDDGRLMVIINFNMDLGDAWEHADTPEYSLKYTTRAYKYAINYILYAMTH